jgi:hypothetical protein
MPTLNLTHSQVSRLEAMKPSGAEGGGGGTAKDDRLGASHLTRSLSSTLSVSTTCSPDKFGNNSSVQNSHYPAASPPPYNGVSHNGDYNNNNQNNNYQSQSSPPSHISPPYGQPQGSPQFAQPRGSPLGNYPNTINSTMSRMSPLPPSNVNRPNGPVSVSSPNFPASSPPSKDGLSKNSMNSNPLSRNPSNSSPVPPYMSGLASPAETSQLMGGEILSGLASPAVETSQLMGGETSQLIGGNIYFKFNNKLLTDTINCHQ